MIKMTAFDKAWGVVKNDVEIAECQRLAIEHTDDDYGAEPCILHGGDGDWCWAAALPVNEDGSYCYSMMAGEAGANCACINCEEANSYQSHHSD